MSHIRRLIGEAEDLWSGDPFEIDSALGDRVTSDPEEAYREAVRLGKGNVPEWIERVIAKSPYYSYHYAVYILRSRFRMGEQALSQYVLWRRLWLKYKKFFKII